MGVREVCVSRVLWCVSRRRHEYLGSTVHSAGGSSTPLADSFEWRHFEWRHFELRRWSLSRRSSSFCLSVIDGVTPFWMSRRLENSLRITAMSMFMSRYLPVRSNGASAQMLDEDESAHPTVRLTKLHSQQLLMVRCSCSWAVLA